MTEEDIRKELGERCAYLRQLSGKRKSQIMREMGKTKSQVVINRIENGSTGYLLSSLLAYLDAVGGKITIEIDEDSPVWRKVQLPVCDAEVEPPTHRVNDLRPTDKTNELEAFYWQNEGRAKPIVKVTKPYVPSDDMGERVVPEEPNDSELDIYEAMLLDTGE